MNSPEWFLAVGLFAVLFAAQEFGFRLGRIQRAQSENGFGPQLGAVQASVIGLLGLLLGLSFSGSTNRYHEKQDLITREANAIGTALLRADMLDTVYRDRLRSALLAYTDHRLAVSKRLREGLSDHDSARIAQLHADMWEAARAGTIAAPHTMTVVLPPVNDIFDLHTLRMAAAEKRLPYIVVGLLVVSSALAMSVITLGSSLSGRRHTFMYGSLAVVIGVTLWIIIDLDHPRAGMLQLSDAPLELLRI